MFVNKHRRIILEKLPSVNPQTPIDGINAQRKSRRSIARYLIRLNMTENLSAQTIHDSSTSLLFRAAAQTSLQFLHRIPLDAEYASKDEDEDRIQLTNGATYEVNVPEAVIDRLKHPHLYDTDRLPHYSPHITVSFARGRAVGSMVTIVSPFLLGKMHRWYFRVIHTERRIR
jgi:hypothetical protein